MDESQEFAMSQMRKSVEKLGTSTEVISLALSFFCSHNLIKIESFESLLS